MKIVVSSKDFFRQTVQDAFTERRMPDSPLAKDYICTLLEHYVYTSNLFDVESEDGRKQRSTLAELYLTATSQHSGVRIDLLKKLGDVSLYISGYFGESLQRKVVDVDYYANMGGVAYATLSSHVRDSHYRNVYLNFSHNFMDYVELLTLISKKTRIQNESNLLLLFDRFVSTGSEEASKSLIEKGLVPPAIKKVTNQ
jgi:hypothetical protein